MNILVPTELTPAMFVAGTSIPAVDTDAGEVAWVSGGSYVLKDERTEGDWIYECVKAAPTSTVKPGTTAAADTWLRKRPTNRMAPFADEYLYTKARKLGSIKYVIQASFITGLALYAMECDRLKITVTEQPSGINLVPPVDVEMYEQAFGEWEYLFGELAKSTKYTLRDIPLRPSVEITIELIANDPASEVAIGFASVGQWNRLLSPKTSLGAAQYGAEVSPKSYGYYKENFDGTFERVKGRQSVNMTVTCIIDAGMAPASRKLLERILDATVAVDTVDAPAYSHLSTVGTVTGTVISETWSTARVDLTIKGNV